MKKTTKKKRQKSIHQTKKISFFPTDIQKKTKNKINGNQINPFDIILLYKQVY